MAIDKSKYIGPFKAETRDHVQRLVQGLLELEKNPADQSPLDMLMREAHSIKGTATMMGYKRIADLAHAIEDALEHALRGNVTISTGHIDVLLKCLDAIEPLLEDTSVTNNTSGAQTPFADELAAQVRTFFFSHARESSDSNPASTPLENHAAKNDTPVHAPAQPFKHQATATHDDSIRVDVNRLDSLMELSGELLVANIRLTDLSRKLSLFPQTMLGDSGMTLPVREYTQAAERINHLSTRLQKEIMQVRMLPVSFMFNSFPRHVRDLAHELNKEVSLEITGENTLLDKNIASEMREPLMHLLRNAVDHGIESPAERTAAGKPSGATIRLRAFQKGAHVVMEIADDGRGIDLQKIRQTAVSNHMITESKAAALSPGQLYEFLFMPGFSTRENVTELSGRGVGLNVVRDTVLHLSGHIDVVSSAQGTAFTIRLPLTLSVTENLLLSAGNQRFALPVSAVRESVRMRPDEIQLVEGKEAVSIRGQVIPVIRLKERFALAEKGIFEKRYYSIVIIQSAEQKAAIITDKLLGRYPLVMKPLGDPLSAIPDILGAAVLGSGEVILVLDPASLISPRTPSTPRVTREAPGALTQQRKRKTILLAEDTMTTAMLEKNVLESVGYSVVLARDGAEAAEKINHERFDAVITDVLMPRMNGFELTRTIKQNPAFHDVPVIILTTRENDTDRRRGMDAGADAYLLKSEFTSDGLLELLEQLLG